MDITQPMVLPTRSAPRADVRPVLVPRIRPAMPSRPTVRWARHLDDVREAQRLRHEVFALEMGAQLPRWPGADEGLDIDRFDEHCEHLLVVSPETDDAPSRVVGTYRVLTPAGARQAGGWYGETEFDLSPLHGQRHRVAELGRSCTAADWRQGGVILMLWTSLASFMQRNGLDLMIGCASVPMHDGGHSAASLWKQLQQPQWLAPESLQVQARLPLPIDQLRQDLPAEPPPLVKGYLRCGARLLGAPAWDPDFGVADLPMMLDLGEMDAAYRARLLRG
jgi:putative hemolysin